MRRAARRLRPALAQASASAPEAPRAAAFLLASAAFASGPAPFFLANGLLRRPARSSVIRRNSLTESSPSPLVSSRRKSGFKSRLGHGFFRRFLEPWPVREQLAELGERELAVEVRVAEGERPLRIGPPRLLTDRRHQRGRKQDARRSDGQKKMSPSPVIPRALSFQLDRVIWPFRALRTGEIVGPNQRASSSLRRSGIVLTRKDLGRLLQVPLELVFGRVECIGLGQSIGDCGERLTVQHPAHDHPAHDPRLGVDLELGARDVGSLRDQASAFGYALFLALARTTIVDESASPGLLSRVSSKRLSTSPSHFSKFSEWRSQ